MENHPSKHTTHKESCNLHQRNPTTINRQRHGAKHNALAFKHPVEFSRNKHTPELLTEVVRPGALSFFLFPSFCSSLPARSPAVKSAPVESIGHPQVAEFLGSETVGKDFADPSRMAAALPQNDCSGGFASAALSGALLVQAYLARLGGSNRGPPRRSARPTSARRTPRRPLYSPLPRSVPQAVRPAALAARFLSGAPRAERKLRDGRSVRQTGVPCLRSQPVGGGGSAGPDLRRGPLGSVRTSISCCCPGCPRSRR
jgi:hypothetical protein